MDRTEKANYIVRSITELLPCIYNSEVDDDYKMSHFLTDPDGTVILNSSEKEIECIANFIDQLYGEETANTGYYDPERHCRINQGYRKGSHREGLFCMLAIFHIYTIKRSLIRKYQKIEEGD